MKKMIAFCFLSVLVLSFPVWPSGIVQSAYNLILNAGSAVTMRQTLNFTGTGVSVADNSGANRTDVTITAGTAGGVNTQTGNYTLQASDNGKLVIMNCSSACTATLFGTPSSTYFVSLQSIGGTTATVSLNSLTLNGASAVPALIRYQTLNFWSDGTNYFSQIPSVAGTNVTLTPATNGLTYAASGGGGGSGFFQTLTAPVAASFSQVNFNVGTGVTSTQVNNSSPVNSITLIQADPNATLNIAGIMKNKVAATFTLTEAFTTAQASSDFGGLCLSNGTAVIIWGNQPVSTSTSATNGFRASAFTNFTTYGSDILAPNWFEEVGPLTWLRIVETVSARTYSISADGINWIQLLSESNTAHFTTSEYGICAEVRLLAGTPPSGVTLYSFAESNP